MKQMSKKELIKVLCNKSNYTYNELAILTGYHPKSLARIYSMIKKGKYNIIEDERNKMYKSIITEFLNSNCKTYKEFYNSNFFEYNVSYSTLCKILKLAKPNIEIVFINKIKNKGNYYFEVIDYANKSILFTYDSVKNDVKSIKNIIYLLIKNYGSPKNISFVRFFTSIPTSIQSILNKYDINVVCFKSSYRNCFNHMSNAGNVKYRQKKIIKEDFYNNITRKTIADNIIQFNNIRYKIETKIIIKHNTTIILYYDDSKKDLFIKFNNVIYKLIPFEELNSKKGISKYY